ncbi:MAG TPA: DinB family protein [Actinomycetota bacterium]|nr:DinB family protein [Actinomycetota bacterium]
MTVPPAPAPGDRAARLLAAAGRIRAHVADWPPGVLTTPDADTGERWDAGQLLAHVAEMLPYWTQEAELVAASGGGVAFGRVKTDPDRVAAIERDRREHLSLLLGRIDEGVAEVLQLVDGLDGEALAREGTHQTLGRMTVAGIVDRFLVDHLEEHAEQIEGVVPPVP